MRTSNIIILALAVVAVVEFIMLQQGCGRVQLGGNCPEQKVIEKIVKVKGETEKRAPVSRPKETVEPMPILKPILVATFEDKGIYMEPTDTAAIVSDYFIKREYTEDVSDTNITASINATIQFNRLQDYSLNYEFEKEEHTTLYDRFQFHLLAQVGIQSNLENVFRPQLGAGALMEFKTGTGAGVLYDYSVAADEPHGFKVIVSQRLSFRKRKQPDKKVEVEIEEEEK